MKPRLLETTPTIAKINVTPIIDVALVLVIILLITAPMISTAHMDINLPEAKTRNLEDEVRLSITVGKDGAIAVDEDSIGAIWSPSWSRESKRTRTSLSWFARTIPLPITS